jgi:hypothetical protein
MSFYSVSGLSLLWNRRMTKRRETRKIKENPAKWAYAPWHPSRSRASRVQQAVSEAVKYWSPVCPVLPRDVHLVTGWCPVTQPLVTGVTGALESTQIACNSKAPWQPVIARDGFGSRAPSGEFLKLISKNRFWAFWPFWDDLYKETWPD